MTRRDELIERIQDALDESRPLDAETLAEIERDPELRRLRDELTAVHGAMAEVDAELPTDLHDRIMARVRAEDAARRPFGVRRIAFAMIAAAAAVAIIVATRPDDAPTREESVAPRQAVATVSLPSIGLSKALDRRREEVRRASVVPFQTAGNFLAGLGKLVPSSEASATPSAKSDGASRRNGPV